MRRGQIDSTRAASAAQSLPGGRNADATRSSRCSSSSRCGCSSSRPRPARPAPPPGGASGRGTALSRAQPPPPERDMVPRRRRPESLRGVAQRATLGSSFPLKRVQAAACWALPSITFCDRCVFYPKWEHRDSLLQTFERGLWTKVCENTWQTAVPGRPELPGS